MLVTLEDRGASVVLLDTGSNARVEYGKEQVIGMLKNGVKVRGCRLGVSGLEVRVYDVSKVDKLYKRMGVDAVEVLRKYQMWYSRSVFEGGKGYRKLETKAAKIKDAKLEAIRGKGHTWVYAGFLDSGYLGAEHCTLGHALRYVHMAWDVGVCDLNKFFVGDRVCGYNLDTMLNEGYVVKFGVECIGDFFQVSAAQKKELQVVQATVLKDNEYLLELYEGGVDVNGGYGVMDYFVGEWLKEMGGYMLRGQVDKVCGVEEATFYREMRRVGMHVPRSLMIKLWVIFFGYEDGKYFGVWDNKRVGWWLKRSGASELSMRVWGAMEEVGYVRYFVNGKDIVGLPLSDDFSCWLYGLTRAALGVYAPRLRSEAEKASGVYKFVEMNVGNNKESRGLVRHISQRLEQVVYKNCVLEEAVKRWNDVVEGHKLISDALELGCLEEYYYKGVRSGSRYELVSKCTSEVRGELEGYLETPRLRGWGGRKSVDFSKGYVEEFLKRCKVSMEKEKDDRFNKYVDRLDIQGLYAHLIVFTKKELKELEFAIRILVTCMKVGKVSEKQREYVEKVREALRGYGRTLPEDYREKVRVREKELRCMVEMLLEYENASGDKGIEFGKQVAKTVSGAGYRCSDKQMFYMEKAIKKIDEKEK